MGDGAAGTNGVTGLVGEPHAAAVANRRLVIAQETKRRVTLRAGRLECDLQIAERSLFNYLAHGVWPDHPQRCHVEDNRHRDHSYLSATRRAVSGRQDQVADLPPSRLKVHTDVGITGYGDYDWNGPPPPFSMVEPLIGRSPFDFMNNTFNLGLGSALYDVMGKYLEVPAYKLLGQSYATQGPSLPGRGEVRRPSSSLATSNEQWTKATRSSRSTRTH